MVAALNISSEEKVEQRSTSTDGTATARTHDQKKRVSLHLVTFAKLQGRAGFESRHR